MSTTPDQPSNTDPLDLLCSGMKRDNEESGIIPIPEQEAAQELESHECIDLRIPKETYAVIKDIAKRSGVSVEQVVSVILAVELPSLAAK